MPQTAVSVLQTGISGETEALIHIMNSPGSEVTMRDL